MVDQHNALTGSALHNSKATAFTGAPGSFTPTEANVFYVRTDVTPNVLYRSTGTSAGNLVEVASSTPGTAATVSVGDVTVDTGTAAATVTNVGTTAAAVFDFGFTFPDPATGTAQLVLTEEAAIPTTAANEIALANVVGALQWRLESNGSTYTVAQRELEENAQTGTTYTLALTDGFRGVTCSNAGAITVTIPTNASVAFPVGTQLMIGQKGAGTVTLDPATGVNLNGSNADISLSGQWAMVSLWKIGPNDWWAVGGIA